MLIWQGKQKPAKQRSLRFRQYEIAFEVHATGVGGLFVVSEFGHALFAVFFRQRFERRCKYLVLHVDSV